ncbi:MAG TPA: hypothetical protein VF756_30810 [Thermoanaerobaculia bacterium]
MNEEQHIDIAGEQRPAYSRALLVPGPLPPLSHLGITLLRYAATTGLRYALYHFGLPLPEAQPFKTIRLRLYFDARELRSLLTQVPGGADVVAALIEPGGAGSLPAAARPLVAALGFHRVRLLRFRPPSSRALQPKGSETPQELWNLFRTHLSRLLPRVNDAFLADLIASVNRRAARAAGENLPPVLSRSAWELRTGGAADLRLFGVPDLLTPSWADEPARAEAARRALEPHSVPGHDRYRGRFREAYRALLSQLSPLYCALARQAAERGFLETTRDACFLPFDLAGDLAADQKPSWLEAGVRSNRVEYESLRRAAEPLDLMTEKQEMSPVGGERNEWEWTPLLPLP